MSDPPAPARTPPPPIAMRCPRAWATLAIATTAALVADLLTKWAAFEYVADDPVTIDPGAVAQVLAADPSKVSALLPPHDPVTVVPSVLDLTLVLNAGAVFGTGQGKRWLFVAFTIGALAFALHVFARWTRKGQWLSHIAIALVIAGGLGNLYDRLRFGVVRDFLHPLPGVRLPFGLKWPSGNPEVWPYISNVADAFLILGIGWLVVRLWRGEPAPDAQAEGDAAPTDD